jgi:hypothetical protein
MSILVFDDLLLVQLLLFNNIFNISHVLLLMLATVNRCCSIVVNAHVSNNKCFTSRVCVCACVCVCVCVLVYEHIRMLMFDHILAA